MSDKYMKNLTFANIAKACDGTYIGDETLLDTTITGAVIDSRQVIPTTLISRLFL